MEKAAGVPLFQVWGSMTEFDRLQLIRNLTRMEAQFSAIRFPAYGGLYLRKDMEQPNKPLDDELDSSFCIGPSCDRRYNPDPSLDFDQGPCESPGYFGNSNTNRSKGIQSQPLGFQLQSVNCYEYQRTTSKTRNCSIKEISKNKLNSYRQRKASWNF